LFILFIFLRSRLRSKYAALNERFLKAWLYFILSILYNIIKILTR
jgi:hypothetical protein